MDRTYYDSFVKKLREMFMMDHAELDFGIYRIMNYKRKEIDDFLTSKLLPQVETILKQNISVDGAEVKRELEKKIAELREEGFDDEAIEKSKPVKELRAKLSSAESFDDMQSKVFSCLTQFFSRYYKDGDFISQRRYKSGGDSAYMIPYNGEEVKLCWANQDQYYIKTSEFFKNYVFILPKSRKKVHFVLKDASTEQNNNKNANGMERRFALWNDEENGTAPLAIVDGDLEIYFTYELMPKATKQKDLLNKAYNMLLPLLQQPEYKDWQELLMNAVKADKSLMDINWLQKHLNDYTAKNSFDYFIHKDLGGFLRRELDFYIKNEVLVVDDLTSAKLPAQLAVIKAIEEVGNKIITFLAQLEDFQKKLWQKKKFVVGCDYCITLDRVPEDMYPEIAANEDQRKEWVRLFAIDEIKGDMVTKAYSEPLTVEFLKQNPFLVLDTKFFSVEFKHKLLASMDDIDGQMNGLLLNSENFQALNVIHSKEKNNIKCVYIDPPYNAKSSEILYKNTYKNSSWLSLMNDRIIASKQLLSNDCVYIVAIDEVEQEVLGQLLSLNFPNSKKICLSVVHNPRGQQGKNISYKHEFAYMIYPSDTKKYLADVKRERIDSRNLRDSGTESDRTDAATCFYPFICKDGNILSIGEVPEDSFHPQSNNVYLPDGSIEIWPIDDNGNEKKWRYNHSSVSDILHKLEVKKGRNSYQIIFNQDMGTMPSVWVKAKYDASEYGTKMLQNQFGEKYIEKYAKNLYPKSLYTELDCINIGLCGNRNNTILDYFAGSGTTGNVALLNQRNGIDTKYILVEMGDYFDTITKLRVEKVIYSTDWSNGKPISREGISQCFKYIRLEQYEDTLNNLVVKNSMSSSDDEGSFDESYMLGYMLDTDTKGSLLNLQMFRRPFDVKIKTTKDNELVETPVDMVETFNYLIGLNVETENWHQNGNICVVEGITHVGNEKTLVIWRNCDQVDNEALNAFFSKQDFNTLDMEFDTIYVNGDNTLPNMKCDDEHWKVIMIEQEFKARMFEEE